MSRNQVEIAITPRDALSPYLRGPLANELRNFSTQGARAMEAVGKSMDVVNRKSQAIVELMNRGLKGDQAIKIATGWDMAAKKAEAYGQTFGKVSETTTRGFQNANTAATGLANMIGVTLPASVTKLLAQSQTIGPVLSAAFSTVAIVGAIQLLGQLPAMFETLKGAITGWDDVAKQKYENFLSYNQKAVEAVRQLRLKQLEALGASPSDIKATEIYELEGERTSAARRAASIRNRPFTFAEIAQGNIASMFGMRNPAVAARNADAERYEGIAESLTQRLMPMRGDLALGRRRSNGRIIQELYAGVGKQIQDQSASARASREFWSSVQFRYGGMGGVGTLPTGAGTMAPGLMTPPSVLTGPPQFFSDEKLAEILRGSQSAIDQRKELLLRADEEIADRSIAMHKRMLDQMQDASRQMVRNIYDSAGAVFDMLFKQGQSVASFFKGIGLTAGRTLFQNVTTSLLVGKGGSGGGLGLLSKVPGLGKAASLFGFGGAAASFAAPLGGAIPLATAGGAAFAPSLGLMASPAIPSIGIGASAVSGAAGESILGMSLSTAIPVFGAIAAGTFFGLKALLKKRPEAEFFSDPFAGERSRTIFFYTGIEHALYRVADSLDRFDTVQPGQVVLDGLPAALQSSNQFRREMGGILMDDDI